MSFDDVAIVSVKENDYGTHIWYMGKGEAMNIIKKFWFKGKKAGHCKNMKKKLSIYKRWIITILIIKEIDKDY